jgi:FAD:protein FMN transferase
VPNSGRVKRLRVALGTLVAIEAASTSDAAAATAVEAAFAAVTQVDRRMHPTSADSDLAKINNAPVGMPVCVHASTCDLLALAWRLHTLTDGVFDPCLPTRAGRLQDVEVSGNEVVSHAPVEIDFGGFAKGYAVDCAIEALMAHGCSAGLVNAGGDLRVFGSYVEPIFLRSATGVATEIRLCDAALAVSDVNWQGRPAEHRGYYVRAERAQLVGTRAVPVRDFAAVRADKTVIADAIAKCVLLCPGETTARVLRAFDAAEIGRSTGLP